MSPLDDELRSALHGRARDVAPAADPLYGIRRRARQIRRRRTGGAVAASALAVAAIAVVVPALVPTGGEQRVAPPVATAPPSDSPAPPAPSPSASPATSPSATPSPYALDPANPWPYRGDPNVAVASDLDAYEVQWAVVHGVLVDDVDLVPLYGRVYEPSATPELVYLVRQPSGVHWWGVARATESGPELVVDEPLPDGAVALAAGLRGDEVARLVVTTSPEVVTIQYGADAETGFTDMWLITPGIATTPLEGDPQTDSVRVLASDGTELFRGPAPDPAPLAD